MQAIVSEFFRNHSIRKTMIDRFNKVRFVLLILDYLIILLGNRVCQNDFTCLVVCGMKNTWLILKAKMLINETRANLICKIRLVTLLIF